MVVVVVVVVVSVLPIALRLRVVETVGLVPWLRRTVWAVVGVW